MTEGPIKIYQVLGPGLQTGGTDLFEGKKVDKSFFLEEKKGKETSLKEKRGKDFFGKKGGGGEQFFSLERSQKVFSEKKGTKIFLRT